MTRLTIFSRKLTLTIGGAILAVISLSACQKGEETPQAAKESVPPLVKTTHPVLIRGLQSEALVGQVVPQMESAVGFRVAGVIEKRRVKLGERVEKGQMLFQLDATDYALKVKSVEAQIRSTESDLKTAKRDLARLTDLRARKLVSQQQVDNAQNAVNKLTAALAALQPQLQLAKNQLAYTQLKAPMEGVVTAILADQGQVVSAGKPVIQVAQLSGKLAQFDLPESLKQQLHPLPQTLAVKVNGQTLNAQLYQQAPAANAISRTWQVAYQLPDSVSQTLAFGQTVIADFIASAQQKYWQVPNTAILMEHHQAYLYTVVKGQLKRKPIQVVKMLDQSAWIRGELTNQDVIVSMGVHTLHPKETVRVSEDG